MLEQRALQPRGPAPGWVCDLEGQGWREAPAGVAGPRDGLCLVKVKSHQQGGAVAGCSPCPFAAAGNMEADGLAGDGAELGGEVEDVFWPTGGAEFCLVREGRMVTVGAGDAVREWLDKEALAEWGERRPRERNRQQHLTQQPSRRWRERRKRRHRRGERRRRRRRQLRRRPRSQ